MPYLYKLYDILSWNKGYLQVELPDILRQKVKFTF